MILFVLICSTHSLSRQKIKINKEVSNNLEKKANGGANFDKGLRYQSSLSKSLSLPL